MSKLRMIREYCNSHPIANLILFNCFAIPLAIVVGLLIDHFTNLSLGFILFIESMFVLVLCYSAVSGDSGQKTFSYKQSRLDESVNSYHGSYAFAIKYGILGVFLFILSGVFGMK